jgi:hypothetical protein
MGISTFLATFGSDFSLPLSKIVYIRTDDLDLPAFYFDPLTNPISLRWLVPKNMLLVPHEETIFGLNGSDQDDFVDIVTCPTKHDWGVR